MKILELIAEYMRSAETAIELFNRAFGRKDILKAWREGVIPQSGKLPGGVEYQFHGVGCWVELPDGEIDFDFAYNNDVGFDSWRLWSYARYAQNRYPEYQGEDDLVVDLKNALAAGLIEPFENCPRLFRIKDM